MTRWKPGLVKVRICNLVRVIHAPVLCKLKTNHTPSITNHKHSDQFGRKKSRFPTEQFVDIPTFVTKVMEYLRSGGFFLQTNFDFLTSLFWRNFISFKKYCCPELKFEKLFYLWSFFVKLWGFKDGQFETVNVHCFALLTRGLIRLRNRSKLVERSLFAIIVLLPQLFRLSKKTEYICSMWFFCSVNFRRSKLYLSTKIFIPHWRYQLFELKFKNIFYLQFVS